MTSRVNKHSYTTRLPKELDNLISKKAEEWYCTRNAAIVRIVMEYFKEKECKNASVF